MRHVFRLIGFGWKPTDEGIWFDADLFSKEEAEGQFKPVKLMSSKGPYTAFSYLGELYRFVNYLGIFEDDEMPGDSSKET